MVDSACEEIRPYLSSRPGGVGATVSRRSLVSPTPRFCRVSREVASLGRAGAFFLLGAADFVGLIRSRAGVLPLLAGLGAPS